MNQVRELKTIHIRHAHVRQYQSEGLTQFDAAPHMNEGF